MFGYVCVNKAEMKIKDYETYKAVYCSLCKRLGKDYRFFSRFLLNYDLTFFALLSMSKSEDKLCIKKKRCCCNPLKTCNYVCNAESDDSLGKASALLVIMAYYKLIDNIDDGGFFSKIGYTFLRPYFSHIKKKAGKKYPEYLKACEKMYEMQCKAEVKRACIDESAEPTAKLLETVFSLEAPKEKLKPVYAQFGYHLGKWIYLMDAAADIDEDIKRKSFNPIYEKLKLPKSESMQYANELLSQSVYLLTSAYNLIDKYKFKDILDNIVLLGLPKKQDEVLCLERKNNYE